MEPNEVTLTVLREIRDEIRTTRKELSAKIEDNGRRIEATTHEVGQLRTRVVESEIRIGTALTDLTGTVGGVKTLLAEKLDLRDRVDQCEKDIALLKERVGA